MPVRTKTITVRVTLYERTKIKVLARSTYKTMGMYVRDRALQNRESNLADKRITKAIYSLNELLSSIPKDNHIIEKLREIKEILNGGHR